MPSHPTTDDPPSPSNYYPSQTLDLTSSASSSPRASLSPFQLKAPLSRTPSPLVPRHSQASSVSGLSQIEIPKPEQRFSRPVHVDSPTLYHTYPAQDAHEGGLEDYDAYDYYEFADEGENEPSPDALRSRNIAPTGETVAKTETSQSELASAYDDLIADLGPEHVHDASEREPPEEDYLYRGDDNDAESTGSSHHTQLRPDSPSMFVTRPTPPHLKLETASNPPPENEVQTATTIDTATPASAGLASTQLNKPLPRSPAPSSPLAGLFSWGKGGSAALKTLDSPSVTDFSSSAPSPLLSPAAHGSVHGTSQGTAPTSAYHEKGTNDALGINEFSILSNPPGSSVSPHQVEEMEDELKAIGSELAGSIRRELDLEDLVDRLQEQIGNHGPSKRSSDYFSDSGYSSAKVSEAESSREEVERIQRRSEQEKAQLRLELTNKLQDERDKRRELDQQIKQLAEKASHIDLAQMNNIDAKDRVQDLEKACEDLRRKLSEERQSKGNFEDLLSALKGELQDACNERDNLRDEVVPQLRARVEGLESQAAEYSSLTYETTKMQQELQSLKKENVRLQGEPSSSSSSVRASVRMSGGLLDRSNSVASRSMRNQLGTVLGLSRSDSLKKYQNESREQLAERLRDVELQRDALHSALKSLLERQEFQSREHAKKVKSWELERNKLLAGPSRKGGFERDISKLRTEINVLRRRAEDAIEEKWQVEKGLGGLKMDLDRAEEEISSLRSLLQEKDILIPPSMSRHSGSSDESSSSSSLGEPATSDSLERAYEELRAAYAESLERIKTLELDAKSDDDVAKTQQAMKRLEKSLSVAVSQRDAAVLQVDSFLDRFNSLAAGAGGKPLAEELADSAELVDLLANQVQHQLARNADLRDRLTNTVARGDRDHRHNSSRIAGLQEKLRGLEDQLVMTQGASEEIVSGHEEDISNLHNAHNSQLSRLGNGRTRSASRSLMKGNAGSVPLRVQAAVQSIEEETEVKSLRMRISELERALGDAEREMQEVIARMSTAQIEVLNLQEEREKASKETKRLQKLLEQGKSKNDQRWLTFGL